MYGDRGPYIVGLEEWMHIGESRKREAHRRRTLAHTYKNTHSNTQTNTFTPTHTYMHVRFYE